jgi:hypothetical protein
MTTLAEDAQRHGEASWLAWRKRRRRWVALRLAMVIGLLGVGVSLHFRGYAFVVVRVGYFVLVFAFLAWRVNQRKNGRRRW